MRILTMSVVLAIASPTHAQGFLYFLLEDERLITCNFCCPNYVVSGCHQAIDYRAANNTPIFAADEGTVEYIVDRYPSGRDRSAGYGNRVDIRHDNGYLTRYAHLMRNSIVISVGNRVQAGQQIALSDNSGFSTGPHLHFEVRDPDGRRVNPYGDPPDYEDGCGTNPLWATCPPVPWNDNFADSDADGWSVAQGDCLDQGETPEGVPAADVHPGAEEVCNYVDDNCNGVTDEGFERVLTPCSVGLGACRREALYGCTADFRGIACGITEPWPPSEEVCDGEDLDDDGELDPEFDNDCDGEVDEDWPLLGSECTRGAVSCGNFSERFIVCDGLEAICDAEALPVDCTGKCGLLCGAVCTCPAGQTCSGSCTRDGCWSTCMSAGASCMDTCPIGDAYRCSLVWSGYYNWCRAGGDSDPCLEWSSDFDCRRSSYSSSCCEASPWLPAISDVPRCYCL